MSTHAPDTAGRGWIAAGPLFVAAAVGVWWVSDRLLSIGPFDRATVGWAVVVPLLALAPGVAGLGEGNPGRIALSRRVADLTAVAIGVAVMALTLGAVTWANCRPVATPFDILPQAVIVGLLGGASYAVPYRVGTGFVRSGQTVAGLIAAGGLFLALAGLSLFIVFVALFPPLSCAAPH